MGQAYFYNMTSELETLTVNGFVQDPIAALPSSAPYTPNRNGTTYNRYNTPNPQQGQFGTTNTITYALAGGAGGNVNMQINVNFHAYNVSQDILIYLYQDAVVVTVLSDNNAYFGLNNTTINVDPSDTGSLLSRAGTK